MSNALKSSGDPRVPFNGGIALVIGAVFAVTLYGGSHRFTVAPVKDVVAAQSTLQQPGEFEYRGGNVPVGASDGRIRTIANYLGKRYLVSKDAVAHFAQTAFSVGREVNVDPLLILAVIAIESRFNPVAESSAGAQGLMQVIPKYHEDKIPETETDPSLLDPRLNVLVGAKVLKDYLRQSGGDLKNALQVYNGSRGEASAQYARKVMAEKERIRQSIGGEVRTAENG